MSRYFDLSALAPAELEFPLLADTHDMDEIERGSQEFPSRSLQGRRVETALRLIEELPGDFLVHLGDLIQSYPESVDYEKAFDRAWSNLSGVTKKSYVVAGNHDIGDKPDPTMPTYPVRSEILERFHEKCGRSWRSIRKEGWRVILLNSQLFNSGMNAENDQRIWLERELEDSASERKILLLHLPLYLGYRDEPALGNYDVIDEKSREWLIGLIERYDVDVVGGAHVHFPFYDRIGLCDYHQFVSTTFTRPGFAHLFASAAPAERGRDDRGKLGFYLMRMRDGKAVPYFIRTYGATDVEELIPVSAKLIVAPRSLPGRHSPLGVTMKQPLAARGVVPIAFPSVRRQAVRCDLPLITLQELGVQRLRLPIEDWKDPLQLSRIESAINHGIVVTAIVLSETAEAVQRAVEDVALAEVDRLEWQLAGRQAVGDDEIRRFRSTAQSLGARADVAPVYPGEKRAGKQHPRTSVGYPVEDLTTVGEWLQEVEAVDGVVCRMSRSTFVWKEMSDALVALRTRNWKGEIHFSMELSSMSDAENAWRLLQGIAFCSGHENVDLFVDPLLDLDRTMDETLGLCDPLFNPRGSFIALRTFNGLLYPENGFNDTWRTRLEEAPSSKLIHLDRPGVRYTLVKIDGASTSEEGLRATISGLEGRPSDLIELQRGLRRTLGDDLSAVSLPEIDVNFPFLLATEISKED